MANSADYHTDSWYVGQLHALAIAIYQARQRNDKAAVSALLDRFEALADEYRARGASDMTPFDNFVLATGNWIRTSVDAIPQAIAALPSAIGFGLLQGAVPWIVLGGLFLYFKGKL